MELLRYTIPYLDILISRKRNNITTTVYRKSTCNGIYLNLNAFAPATWKRVTLKTLVERVYVICSTDQRLEKELKYLEKAFHEKNNYPKHMLVLPYQGKKGNFIIKSMRKRFKSLLPQYIVPTAVFAGSKLSSKLQVKDRTIFSHNDDIIYHGNCPENYCPNNCIGETARRISERVLDHTGKGINSHLYKHSFETGHQTLEISDYRIIRNEYGNNWKKGKIAEALLIKELKPALNKQDKSIPLKLFN